MANPRQDEKIAHAYQSAQETTRRAGEKAAEQASRVGRAAADAGENMARAGADLLQHNAETVQNAWQCGLDIATKMTEHSTDHFARTFGLSGDEAQQAMQQSARNVEALLQSTNVLARGIGGMSREWFEFLRSRMDHNLNRVDDLMRCRTPQDFAALQSELVRDNVEGVLQSSRRLAELSLQVADSATKKMTENGDAARRAA
jgi:phasin family protein